MFKDYVNAVVKEYHDKVASNTISLNLTPLTPGNVKKECKAVCIARFRKSDERLLSAFFGHAENQNGYLQAIQRCDIDKFRPMINFVEGRSKDTDAKNIELLAWLIDFKERPFDGKYGGVNQPIGVDEPGGEIDDSPNLKNDPQPPPVTETNVQPMLIPGESPARSPQKSRLNKKLLVTTTLIVILLAGTVGYISLNKPTSGGKSSSNDSCMYWKDDHYERISCGQKVQYSKVVALDTDILNNFRRIIIPDTITYNSIGKVWYIKIKGKPEFYTDMGYHPIFTQLQLKPITKYIIDAHIRRKILPIDSAASSSQAASISLGQPNGFRLLSKQLKAPSEGIYGQCQATTKAKTRCSRKANFGGFCWQHEKHRA